MGLLREIKVEGSEDDIDTTLQLEKRIDAFLIGEYLEGNPILPVIIEVVKALLNSVIETSKQHRMKRLLDDIKAIDTVFTLYSRD